LPSYDPRTGIGALQGEIHGGGHWEFRSPPQGPDWVLVLDNAASHYAPPGLRILDRASPQIRFENQVNLKAADEMNHEIHEAHEKGL
jgi:hypothetical protein